MSTISCDICGKPVLETKIFTGIGESTICQEDYVLEDFKAWSGGFHPSECDDVARLIYLESALPISAKREDVEAWLRRL